jgi:hypothetical protein
MAQAAWFSANDAYIAADPSSLSGFSMTVAEAESSAASLPTATRLSGLPLSSFIDAVTNPANGAMAYSKITETNSVTVIGGMINQTYSGAAQVSGLTAMTNPPIHCGPTMSNPNNFGCSGPVFNCSDANWMAALGAWMIFAQPDFGSPLAAIAITMQAIYC